jgi:uncharacterized protein YjiS (DUF1127 family)
MRSEASSLRAFWCDRPVRALFNLASWVSACAERSAQRRALAELDGHRLRDIGVSRTQAAAEAAKPFWRR